MVDFNEVEKEIINIESSRDTSYATMERLAPLYCALIYRRVVSIPETRDAKPVDAPGSSEFLEMVNGKSSAEVWEIIDQHMSLLKVMFPKQYASVLNQIALLD